MAVDDLKIVLQHALGQNMLSREERTHVVHVGVLLPLMNSKWPPIYSRLSPHWICFLGTHKKINN